MVYHAKKIMNAEIGLDWNAVYQRNASAAMKAIVYVQP
jgi:hypothetical protein